MKLYPFQRDGVDLLTDKTRAILADEMGLGKTAQALIAADKIGVRRVLVVCPNSMKGVVKDDSFLGGWAGEIVQWLGSRDIAIVSGWHEQRVDIIDSGARWTLINYEVLSKHIEDLREHWDLIIFDEVHRVKTRGTKVTRAAKMIARTADHVWMLSGTPMMNSVSELWQLLNILFPKDKEYSSYWRFVNKYCNVSYDYWGHAIVADVMDPTDPRIRQIRALLEPVLIRRTKAEVLKDMPGKTIQKVWVELHDLQRQYYDEMEDEMLTELDSGETISATVVIAQIMRLKQICVSPSLLIDNVKLWGAKTQAVSDLLDSLQGEKVVVFSQFKTAIDQLYEGLIEGTKYSVARFTGDTSQDDRAAIVESFQTTGDPQILLVTTQAGGTGLTLTAASHAIFLDKLWTPAMNLQAQDRLHRIGQDRPVTIYEILAAGTIEERIEETLAGKQLAVDLLLETAEALEARGEMVKTAHLTGRELLKALYPGRDGVSRR